MKVAILFCLVAIALADSEVAEESSFELPSDWANIRSNIDTSFSCVGRAYGYYADIANDCQLYHVCQPRIENDVVVYRHDPFICPISTVFDQKTLTCVHSNPEFSCANSVQYYAETESRLNNVEHSDVVEPVVHHEPIVHHEPVVHEPVVENVHHVVPPVNDHVVVEPLVVNAPVVNATLYGVESSAPLNPLPAVPVVHHPIHAVVSNITDVHSNNVVDSSEVADVPQVVNTVVGRSASYYLPVRSRYSQQTQELLNVRKGYQQPLKSIEVVKRSPVVQQVVKTPEPVKYIQPVKSVQQNVEPVKYVQPVKSVQQNVEPVKLVQPVKSVQQNVEPVKYVQPAKSVQQNVEPVKYVQPVKSVQQNVEPVKLVQPVKSVQQNVEPVKYVQPAKSVQQNVEPVKYVQPAKSVQQSVVPVKYVQPAKSVQLPVYRPLARQTQQLVEMPRKSQGPVTQELQRTYYPRTYYLHNGQPSWRHHYLRLYPHLIHNNPYHVRHATRWV